MLIELGGGGGIGSTYYPIDKVEPCEAFYHLLSTLVNNSVVSAVVSRTTSFSLYRYTLMQNATLGEPM